MPYVRRKRTMRPRRRYPLSLRKRSRFPRRRYRRAIRTYRPRLETKYVDSTSSSTIGATNGGGAAYSSLGSTGGLGICAQGLTTSTRIGNSQKLKSLLMTFHLGSQTNTKDDLRIRIQLIRWNKFENATSPNFTLLYDVDSYYSTINMNSMRNIDYMREWTILKTKVYKFPAQQQSGQTLQRMYKFGYRFKPRQGYMRYKGTANTDLVNGNYFLLATADGGDIGAALTGLAIAWKIRTWFVDA